MRLRFILGLIILGVALQFIAKTLNGVLPLIRETARYSASSRMLQPVINLQTQTAPPPRIITPQKLKTPRPKEMPKKPETPPESAFMQITLEDLRPPVKNAALGAEASARLETFLIQKREQNAQLADETGTLFGREAKQKVINVLVEDERASLANARESKTAREYADRQKKTDAQTDARLTAVFEKYKKQFNSRLNENSPAWNDFFKRVNDFQKAAD